MFFDVLFLQIVNNIKYSVNNIYPEILNTKMQSQIRSFNRNNFPKVNEFVNFNNTGVLLDPNEVAIKIRLISRMMLLNSCSYRQSEQLCGIGAEARRPVENSKPSEVVGRYFVATPLRRTIHARRREQKALTFCTCQAPCTPTPAGRLIG